jgi:hypothetical protein
MARSTAYSTRTEGSLGSALIVVAVRIDANELDDHASSAYVARAPVAILRPPHRARVHEVDAVDNAMPRLVRVAERDHVAGLRTRVSAICRQNRPDGPRSSRPCSAPGCRAAGSGAGPATWPPSGRTSMRNGSEPRYASSPRHVCARPLVRQVRQLLLPRVLVLAAAVLVVRRRRAVVVAGDPGIARSRSSAPLRPATARSRPGRPGGRSRPMPVRASRSASTASSAPAGSHGCR